MDPINCYDINDVYKPTTNKDPLSFELQELASLQRLNKEDHNTGIIYRITNVLNGKMYFGQTLSYRIKHNQKIRFGMKKRYDEHMSSVSKGSRTCPKLYEAVCNYGINAFICNQILICDVKNLDAYEIFYIIRYKTYIYGYNALIGNVRCKNNSIRRENIGKTFIDKWQNDQEYIEKTKKGNLISLKKRAATGENRTKHKDLPGNIYKNKNGGYDIRVIREGVFKVTSVDGKNKTDEELLQVAIEKRDKIIHQFEEEGVVERVVKNIDHNENELPQGIIKYSVRNLSGYRVKLIKDGKRIERSFLSGNLTMDEKLENAKKSLTNLKKNFNKELAKTNKNKQPKKLDHNGNELPKGIIKIIARGSEGYQISYKVANKKRTKNVTDSKLDMDTKLEKAKNMLEELTQ